MLAPPAANPALHATMPDDQLMLAYADGDTGAFDTLYARHESALLRFVRRLMGVRLAAEVEEVFQETWMRIIAARQSFSPQGASWRTWPHDRAQPGHGPAAPERARSHLLRP